ncbi:MAG TPA: ATP-binding protein [Herbaspirillum sp.]|jgi:two-component system OmpR family sensor kinase
MGSLRTRLILLLGVAIMAAAVLQFFTAMQATTHEADKLFDFHMKQMAAALQGRSFNHARWTGTDGNTDNFEFVIQIWAEDGAEVYQSRVHNVLPAQAALGYSTVTLSNGDWRVYSERSQNRVIQIAQKMQARQDRALLIAWRSVWPIIPVSLLLFGLAWWVITSALSPLNRIGRDIANRNADSLAPIPDKNLPEEVVVLVSELNSLLARMGLALLSQQRFVADAAHELRSPVTALTLQLQTLARAKDGKTQTEAVERLRGGIDRASRLIEQLLVLARQDPLSQIFETAEVSLSTCIELAIEDVKHLSSFRQIQIRYEASIDGGIVGDAEALRIMIRNLIDNAVRYTPEQGTVLIDLAVAGSMLVLTIQDSGSGISQSNRPRVFDRFYRVPGTRTGGTGLGLAIVKAIADRHRAIVELHHAPIGGLEVKISFP